MRRKAVALALALSACASTPGAVRPAGYVPDAGGIALTDSPLRIDFGRAEAGAIAAVTRLEAAPPRDSVECGGGVRSVRWQGGLALQFRGGAFLGWTRADGTSAGLGCAA